MQSVQPVTKLEHALAHAAKGFKVFPIKPGVKAPPLLNGWPQRATSDPDTVREYWAAVPDANIGIHCEGLIVIDVDVKKGGDESLQQLEMIYGLPETLTVRTPTGGRHLYYRTAVAVSNSVGALATGLDMRSDGGYVVAPGSEVEAGRYVVEQDVSIADAPAWLVERLNKVKPVSDAGTDKSKPVSEAPVSVVDRAAAWLAGQEPAVEGRGGDARTYAVACALRDLGVAQQQAFALLQDGWNQRCLPPWNLDDLWTKVRNAYEYSKNEAGSRAALPDDFPIVAQESSVPEHKSLVLRLSDFANRDVTKSGYLVKGLLQRRSYAELYGQPGAGKTFVALDIAYHVAAGKPWMQRKVHAGNVLYLAYEGTGGLVKRAQALRQKHGKADVPFYVMGAAMNLREQTGRHELRDVLAAIPEKPVLIVIDTFARALQGGDENSAQDVGAFNAAVAALIESTGACVLLIHHSGKNKAAGARGSSSLQGAIDTELEVDGNQVTARKQRDVEVGLPIGFQLAPVLVGVDEDGDDITSCVVEPASISTYASFKPTGKAAVAWQVLCELRPNNKPLPEDEWKAAFIAAAWPVDKPNESSQKTAWRRAVSQLKGHVKVTEQGWQRTTGE